MFKVYDSIMGSGKSTRMIEEINNSLPETRWIVVTPFLAECHRYAGTVIDESSQDKQSPKRDSNNRVIYNGTGCNESGRKFYHPESGYRSKVENIAEAVRQGKDIVTTHAALKLFNPSTIAVIKDNGYKLVIDEELECVKPVPVSLSRRKMLLNAGAVYVDDDGLLRWSEDYNTDEYDSEDEDDTGYGWDKRIKALCDNGSLILAGEDNRSLFMWEYPIDFLKAFDDVSILTYMFDGSVFDCYLRSFGIVPLVIKQPHADYSSLIRLVLNDKMNRPGDREYSLSATEQGKWDRKAALPKTIKTYLESYFKNPTYGGPSVANDRLWTCLKGAQPYLKGKGYTKQWLAANTKAVNDYQNTHKLAYVYNAFMHPEVSKYLQGKGNTPNSDVYALSELLQWVFRSRVRNGEEISLYIPSNRMRKLLIEWLQ